MSNKPKTVRPSEKNKFQHVMEEKHFLQQHEKRQHYFDILKAFLARHSSEYKTLDSDRKVNRNIYPDAVTRDRMRLIDSMSGQLEQAFSMSK